MVCRIEIEWQPDTRVAPAVPMAAAEAVTTVRRGVGLQPGGHADHPDVRVVGHKRAIALAHGHLVMCGWAPVSVWSVGGLWNVESRRRSTFGPRVTGSRNAKDRHPPHAPVPVYGVNMSLARAAV